MRFTNAENAENIVWQMRLSDWPRAQNRALINSLFNGFPPFTPEEQRENRINTNTNFLEATKAAHDARRQFYNGLIAPDPVFSVTVDHGAKWQRQKWSLEISKLINRTISNSHDFFEVRRSVYALLVLHGIGPSNWDGPHDWCPIELGVEDVLVPSDTRLTLKNLPFFAVFRQYTAMELWKQIQPKRNSGWNKPMVMDCIKWAEDQSRTLMGNSWPKVWSPEKMEERIKGDGALYSSDCVPTIDCFDVYYWDDRGGAQGWRRRIILDAWGDPGVGGAGGIPITAPTIPDKTYAGTRGEFLFDSGDRVVASNLNEIMHWQFADLSSVAPFRYHTVRSLGFLLYSVCQLQNRLRCRFNDSVFEALLQFFRVSNPADVDRLTQIDLQNHGILPEGLDFVKAQERWTAPQQLAESAMFLNRQTMAENSSSFTQDFDTDGGQNSRETATRTMAKVNATAALVGAMLSQAYKYESFRDREICRRFCRPKSKNMDVQKFRLACLKSGIPEEALDVDKWDVKPNRVIGSGNKEQQIMIANAMMQIRPLLGPEAQKRVDRLYVAAYTEDHELADELVPEMQHISDSVHDAQVTSATLMQGRQVSAKPGLNETEYVDAMLVQLAMEIKKCHDAGNMAQPDQLMGMQTMAQHIEEHIQIVAQDKNSKGWVKEHMDDLGKLQNELKGFEQRLLEQMQAQQQQNGNGQMDPESQAKVQATMLMAQTKSELAKKSHAERTAQKRISFEEKLKQDQQKHEVEIASKDLETASNIRREGLKATESGE